MLTDSDGAVVWQGSYSPFGEVDETVHAVEQNIRFPGQYFEEETGLHYNYFRDYDPGTGRYVESDPIGLDGGINTFGYIGGMPTSGIDPLGLVTYECKRPLNFPSNHFGSGSAIGPDTLRFPPFYNPVENPLYHQWRCTVQMVNGSLVETCGGHEPSGSKWGSAGAPSDDDLQFGKCEISEGDNLCYETCLHSEWEKPRPWYSLLGSNNGLHCQQYDDGVNEKCRKECGI